MYRYSHKSTTNEWRIAQTNEKKHYERMENSTTNETKHYERMENTTTNEKILHNNRGRHILHTYAHILHSHPHSLSMQYLLKIC